MKSGLACIRSEEPVLSSSCHSPYDSSDEKPTGRGTLIFIILTLLFVAARLVVLLTSLELSEIEEVNIGTVALEAAAGSTIPLLDYIGPTDAHEGGLVINGMIAGIFFRLFGRSGFVLKLVWLAFSTGGYYLLLLVMRSGFGFRAAIFTGLFAIASPAFFTYMNLADTEVDSGALFFSILILFSAVRALDARRPFQPAFFLFGFVSGLGAFFSYHTLTMTLTTIALGYLPRIRRLYRCFPALAAGILIGLVPWFVFNISHNFWGLNILVGKVVSGSMPEARFFEHLVRLLASDIPAMLTYENVGPVGASLLGGVFYAGILISLPVFWYSVVKKNNFSRSAAFLPVAYSIVFLITYAMSRFEIGRGSLREYRHLLCFLPVIFAAEGVAVDRLLSTQGRRTRSARLIGVALATVLIIAGILTNAGLVSPGNLNTGRNSIYPSVKWRYLAFKAGIPVSENSIPPADISAELLRKHAPFAYPRDEFIIRDAEKLVAFFDTLTTEASVPFFSGLGEGLGRFAVDDTPYQVELRKIPGNGWVETGEIGMDPAHLWRGNASVTDAECAVSALTPRARVSFCRGYGASTAFTEPAPDRIEIPNCCLSTHARNAFLEGYGIGCFAGAVRETGTEPERAAAAAAHVVSTNEICSQELFRGAGIACSITSASTPSSMQNVIAAIDSTGRTAFIRGIGIGIAWHLYNDPSLLIRMESAWPRPLERAQIMFDREYSYFPKRVINLAANDSARAAFLEGLGRGYAGHIRYYTKFIGKIMSKVAEDLGEAELFLSGIEKGAAATDTDHSWLANQLDGFRELCGEETLYEDTL